MYSKGSCFPQFLNRWRKKIYSTFSGTNYYFFYFNVTSEIRPLSEEFSFQIFQVSITLPWTETEKSLLSSIQYNVHNVNKKWLWNTNRKLFLMRCSCKKSCCFCVFVVGSCWLFFAFVFLSLADEIPVQYCAQPTNGVVYFRAVSSLNTLPEELKPYVPLFCNVITKWEVHFLRSWSNRLQ